MHRHAAPGEWQRDPARPDAELERPPVSGELRQELDHRVDDGRIRLVPVALVEAVRHARPEVILGHARYLRSTRTALTLYSGVPISGSPTSCVSQLTF